MTDFYQWANGQGLILIIPLTVSVTQVAKFFDSNRVNLKTLSPGNEPGPYLLITYPTPNLPTLGSAQTLVAPFLNYKNISWILIPPGQRIPIDNMTVITESYAPNCPYEAENLMVTTRNIEQLKRGVSFNTSRNFKVYLKYPEMYQYVQNNYFVYDHFVANSSILLINGNRLLVQDRS